MVIKYLLVREEEGEEKEGEEDKLPFIIVSLGIERWFVARVEKRTCACVCARCLTNEQMVALQWCKVGGPATPGPEAPCWSSGATISCM